MSRSSHGCGKAAGRVGVLPDAEPIRRLDALVVKARGAIALATLVLAAASLAACGGGGDGGALALTAADSGRTVELGTGRLLTVTLESNATTGFRWNLAEAPSEAVIHLVSSEYVEPKDGRLGEGGVEVWTFEAAGAGTTSLRLEYVRPFDPGDVEGEFVLTIRAG
jgi:inhibitor of cysteine peptidase